MVVLAVIFGVIGALILFTFASLDVWHVFTLSLSVVFEGAHPAHLHETVVGNIIGAIDLYLIAIVLLIFSFGVYELFISKIDPAENAEKTKILEIRSLDQLKDKLAKVIIMVLVVSFFQRVLHMEYKSPQDMLYFAGSIFALALALYFTHKASSH